MSRATVKVAVTLVLAVGSIGGAGGRGGLIGGVGGEGGNGPGLTVSAALLLSYQGKGGMSRLMSRDVVVLGNEK